MKIAMVFVLIIAVVLFMPRYNLYEKESTWSDRYVLRENGFWLHNNCKKAGLKFDNPYRCLETSTWRAIWGGEQVRAQ
jgi:hypothetical protein